MRCNGQQVMYVHNPMQVLDMQLECTLRIESGVWDTVTRAKMVMATFLLHRNFYSLDRNSAPPPPPAGPRAFPVCAATQLKRTGLRLGAHYGCELCNILFLIYFCKLLQCCMNKAIKKKKDGRSLKLST